MSNISRRAFARQAAVAGAAGVLGFPSASYSAAGGWGDPAERLHTMIRIMGRTDGGVAIRHSDGVLSAIIDQATTQILGISQQVFTRHRLNDDGSFDAVYLELVYFSDLQTGSVLETWNNPYTGKAVVVPTQVLGPTRIKIPLSLNVINEPYPMEGIVNTHWLEPRPSLGGDAIFNERIDSYVPPMTEGGAPLKFHEVFSFRAPLAALADKSLAHVPATVDKVNVISWRPWMEMGNIDGVTMSRGAGRVVSDYDEVPQYIRQRNETFFPDVIADIDDYLEI